MGKMKSELDAASYMLGYADGKAELERQEIAKLNDEYLRDTYVEGLSQEQEPVLLNVKTHDDKTYKVEVSMPAQPLSDDEIDKIYYKTFDTYSSEVDIEFARAIEKAHGIGE